MGWLGGHCGPSSVGMVWYRGTADAGRDPDVWREIWGGPGGQPGGILEEGPGGPPGQSGDGEAQGGKEDGDGTPGGRLDVITQGDSGKDSGGGVWNSQTSLSLMVVPGLWTRQSRIWATEFW